MAGFSICTVVDSFFLHILSSKITFKLGSCDILSLSRFVPTNCRLLPVTLTVTFGEE